MNRELKCPQRQEPLYDALLDQSCAVAVEVTKSGRGDCKQASSIVHLKMLILKPLMTGGIGVKVDWLGPGSS